MPLTFVYTPTLDWGFLHQRPQQIARALAQRGHTFYYSQKTQQRGVAPRPLDSAERVIIVHDWEAFQEQITDDMIIYASWGMYHTSQAAANSSCSTISISFHIGPRTTKK